VRRLAGRVGEPGSMNVRPLPGLWIPVIAVTAVLAMVLTTAGCGSGSKSATPATTRTTASAPAGVPAKYRSLYSAIAKQLDGSQRAVDALPAGVSSGMVYGSVLLLADGNRGTALLGPRALPEVDAEIDDLARIGVQGVGVAVSFPLLVPSTPDSSRFLRFYEQVAQAVRRHHMILGVEENPVLVGTPFARAAVVSYAGLTDASYAREQADQAQLIVEHLHPVYLSLMSEPSTDAAYIGLPDLNEPAASAAIVRQEVQAIHRGATLLGAGAGSWSSPQFDRDYATTGVDYIDLHVYPTQPRFVSNAIADAREAKAAKLPVVMDEFYLFPSLTFGPQGTIQKHEIEPFSWLDPLKTRFLRIFTTFAQKEGFAYVVAWDDNTFLADLTWQPGDDTSSLQSVNALYDPVLREALASGHVTAVGHAYAEMIRSHT
jgi:hypothetical protein